MAAGDPQLDRAVARPAATRALVNHALPVVAHSGVRGHLEWRVIPSRLGMSTPTKPRLRTRGRKQPAQLVFRKYRGTPVVRSGQSRASGRRQRGRLLLRV